MRLAFIRQWRTERAQRARASAYATTILAEPEPADVRWLAEGATGGDADHARWELRYARRAAGLLVAERDALDDRTASLVSAALERAWLRDPQIAASRRAIAARQFNTRLAAYGDALNEKNSKERSTLRLARTLLGFAGRLDPTPEELEAAGDRIAGYLREASGALRAAFGEAAMGPLERPADSAQDRAARERAETGRGA